MRGFTDTFAYFYDPIPNNPHVRDATFCPAPVDHSPVLDHYVIHDPLPQAFSYRHSRRSIGRPAHSSSELAVGPGATCPAYLFQRNLTASDPTSLRRPSRPGSQMRKVTPPQRTTWVLLPSGSAFKDLPTDAAPDIDSNMADALRGVRYPTENTYRQGYCCDCGYRRQPRSREDVGTEASQTPRGAERRAPSIC